jgi:hypothetical protein
MNHVLDFYQFINENDEFEDMELIFDKGGKELEKVKLKLKGVSSGKMSKLINEYVRTREAYDDAEAAYEKVKKDLKDSINEKFEIQHQFVTRVIETVKYVITFSKYVKEKREDVIDYKAVVDQLEQLFPEIREGLEEIKKACTETNKLVSSARSGSIKHSHIKVNEGLKDSIMGIINKIKGIFSKLSKSLSRREKRIATRLKRIDALMSA